MNPRHSLSATFCWQLGFAFLIGTLAVFSAAANAADLPRYLLKPGQELSYELVTPRNEWDDPKHGKIIEYGLTLTWKIWVTRVNADGSRRLVYTCHWKSAAPSGAVLDSDGYFDLSTDGRVTNPGTTRPGIGDVTVLFPPLAPAGENSATTWQAASPIDGTVHNMRVLEEGSDAEPDVLLLAEETGGVFNSLYERTERREYAFDRKAGFARSGSIALKQALGQRPFDSLIEITFLGVREVPSEELARLDSETSEILAADEEYQRQVHRAVYYDSARAKELLVKARQHLTDLQPKLSLALTKGMLEAKLKMHDDTEQSSLSNAESFASVLGKPAPSWTTTDFDGKPHALTDYRGKVVVLDFWYRGCTWCVRCMPQIKQLVEEFRGQNVAILGMSNDEAADAQFVIEKAQLNYPTLRDEKQAIRISFQTPSSYPTMIVVDAQGNVRHVHLGYSPTLRQEIGGVIRDLLSEEAARTSAGEP
jgi:peroxiredoxin